MPRSVLVRLASLVFLSLYLLLPMASGPRSLAAAPKQREWGLDFSNPMDFALGRDAVGNDVIFAAGNINAGTVEAFLAFLDFHKIGPGAVVALHSNGNDALVGMQLGRLIRQRSLQTIVGRRHVAAAGPAASEDAKAPLVGPGECDSACSLAFMGGVYREVPPDSVYAIHAVGARVPDLHGAEAGSSTAKEYESGFFMGQVMAGDVEQYLLEMGIESEFLLRFRQYDSNAHRAYTVPQDTLRLWRVINADVETEWSLVVREQHFALIGLNPASAFAPRQHEEVAFRCEGKRHVSMEVAYLPPPASGAAAREEEGRRYELATSGSHLRSVVQTGDEEALALSVIPATDIREPFRATPPDPRIHGRVDVTPRLLQLLTSTPRVVKFGFRRKGGEFYGFPIDFHAVRKTFFNFVAACG